MPVTPLKRIRVEDALWEAFGEAAEAIGSDRTKLLTAFMRRYVKAMDANQSADADRRRPPPPWQA